MDFQRREEKAESDTLHHSLLSYHGGIKLFSYVDDVVLDPFMDQHNLLAAYQNKRKGLGIEIDEEYCQLAEERLRQMNLFAEREKLHAKENNS